MSVKNFVRKPTEAKAIQWTGNNLKSIMSFLVNDIAEIGDGILEIEGMILQEGEWIVSEVMGEFTQMNDEEFKDCFASVKKRKGK